MTTQIPMTTGAAVAALILAFFPGKLQTTQMRTKPKQSINRPVLE